MCVSMFDVPVCVCVYVCPSLTLTRTCWVKLLNTHKAHYTLHTHNTLNTRHISIPGLRGSKWVGRGGFGELVVERCRCPVFLLVPVVMYYLYMVQGARQVVHRARELWKVTERFEAPFHTS